MTVAAASIQVSREAKRPVDLPEHIETWYADQDVDGDSSGGLVQHNFNFNSSDTTREWYVAITSLFVGHVTPMDTALDIRAADWLEWTGHSRLVTVNTDGGTVAGFSSHPIVHPNQPLYLGRVVPGTDGRVYVTHATNNNGEGYTFHARGYISMTPFVIPMTYSR
jgi:hypothetical protein